MRGDRPAAVELKEMLPYILLYDGLLLLGAVIIGFLNGFDWRVFSGLIVGNAMMLLNFWFLGYTARQITRSFDEKRATVIGALSYELRYVVLFIVYTLLLRLDLMNIFSSILPLLFPKLYYTFIYTHTHREDDE